MQVVDMERITANEPARGLPQKYDNHPRHGQKPV